MCGKVDLGCQVKEGFQSVISGQFDAMLRDMNEAALKGLNSLSTFWINVPSPTIATGSGQHWANSGPVGFLQQNVLAVAGVIFTLAVLVAGIRIAWEQRAEPLRELLKATMTFIAVSATGSAVLQLLTMWSDEFSRHVVTTALGDGQTFDGALRNLVIDGGQIGQKLPILIAMFAGAMALVSSLIQIVLLLIRSAMLVLLAGIFPLAAAATNTEVGKAWFKKFCGWALAFIAYKPAAALIYAAAIRMSHDGMMNQTGDGLVQVLTGLMMLALAVIALPALLRFTVPLTTAAAGGGSASGASVADPGGLATGAISVGRSKSGGSGGGIGGGIGSGSGGGGGGGIGGGSGGGGGGGGGGLATGAIGAAAIGAGAALNASKKGAGALSGAVSHSAGEAGGGSSSASGSSASGAGGSGGSRGASRKSPAPRGNSSPPHPKPPPPPPGSSTQTPEPPGPSGNW
jgi:hypothetical protein